MHKCNILGRMGGVLTPGSDVSMSKKGRRHIDAYLLHNENLYEERKHKDSLDVTLVRQMAAIGCTFAEMASLLRVSTAWIQREYEENRHFAIAIEEGRADMKQSLRRAQYKLALSGNATMLIWLGKQHLDQHDKIEQHNKTEISITVQRAMDELRAIPRERLLEAQAMLLTEDVITCAVTESAAENAADNARASVALEHDAPASGDPQPGRSH